MGFCFNLPGHGAFCVGDKFAQLDGAGLGLTETGLAMFALIAATVFFFVFYAPSSR